MPSIIESQLFYPKLNIRFTIPILASVTRLVTTLNCNLLEPFYVTHFISIRNKGSVDGSGQTYTLYNAEYALYSLVVKSKIVSNKSLSSGPQVRLYRSLDLKQQNKYPLSY